MLFRPLHESKPTINLKRIVKKIDCNTRIQMLPDGLFLSIEREKERNLNHTLLFDANKNTVIAYHIKSTANSPSLIVVSNNGILIQSITDSFSHNIAYLLDRNTLSELKNDLLINNEIGFPNGIFLEDQIFPITSKLYGENVIKLIQLSTEESKSVVSEILKIPDEKSIVIESPTKPLVALANDLFACMVRTGNSNKVLLLKRDAHQAQQFQLAGKIEPPKEQKYSDQLNNLTKNSFIGLPDGRLLIWDKSGNDFQIWEAHKLVDQFNLNTIKSAKNDFRLIFEVAALPDAKHLLVLCWEDDFVLYLLNYKTRTVKPVNIGNYQPHTLQVNLNGQVLITTSEKDKADYLLYVDFKEMLFYRTQVTKSLENIAGLNRNLNAIITSYIANNAPWITKNEVNKRPHVIKNSWYKNPKVAGLAIAGLCAASYVVHSIFSKNKMSDTKTAVECLKLISKKP